MKKNETKARSVKRDRHARVAVKCDNGEIRIASDGNVRQATAWAIANYGWVLKKLA